ncbi:sugar transferase [Leuconostoc mesenteroides]|jgi:lipopolysaccharide/colanic/teichoic acid biosynthesis glycosyltransferase|uniref:sugar transferase n=1 Tax=Leuconostoc mesenteroides TaxID=1245 RepID=UPI000FFE2DAA|nr:sugar transferase [Leuconostoc mesenteroides]QAT27936.1 sugar transferase [Leuconostoc mesenteroides]
MGVLKKKDGIVVEKKIIVRKDKTYLFMKRMMDYIGSGIGIIIVSPVLLLIAIIIKFEDGGPVIFKQERVGYNGKRFFIYKFRSMRVDAEQLKQNLLKKNEVKGAMFKIKDDPRVTNFGRFIRKHSLDELPQFFNVLVGDMSLVGPRPPLVEEVEKYTEYEKQRLIVRPGLSGLWQISGRNNLSFSDMVELDLQYIQTRNIILDSKIILKTIWDMISIKKNGAF